MKKHLLLLLLLACAALAGADVLTFDYGSYLAQNGGNPWGPNLSDRPEAVCITSDGTLAIVEHVGLKNRLYDGVLLLYKPGATNPIVVPYRPDFGGRVWGFHYNCAADHSGNLYVVAAYSGNPSLQSFVLMKYTEDGLLLWSKEFASHQNGNYQGALIAVDNEDSAIVAYEADPFFTGNEFINLVKIDSTGQILWGNQINDSPKYDELGALALDPFGNAVVLNERQVAVQDSVPVMDLTLTRFSRNGFVLWKKDLGVNDAAGPLNLLIVPEDGSIYVGANHDFRTADRAYIAKFAPGDGAKLWEDWNGDGEPAFLERSLAMDGSRDVYAVGEVEQPPGQPRPIIRKFSASGARFWTQGAGPAMPINVVAGAFSPAGFIDVLGYASSPYQDFLQSLALDGSTLYDEGYFAEGIDPTPTFLLYGNGLRYVVGISVPLANPFNSNIYVRREAY